MYHEHVEIISQAMRKDVATFKRGVMFAILSARVQFPRVPDQCKELRKRGKDAACLWGWKFDAYSDIEAHGEKLWHTICALDHSKVDTCKALLTLCRTIRGLGLVKGAFVLQMMGYPVACLDAINIVTDGRNPRAYRSDGEKVKQGKAFGRKAERYVIDTWHKASFYWDRWCEAQAEKYGLTAERISQMHVDAICGKGAKMTEIPF